MTRTARFFPVVLLVGLTTLVALAGCRRKPPAAPVTPAAEESSAAPAKSPPAAGPGSARTATVTQPEQPAADRLPTAPPDSSLRLPVQQELTGAVHLYLTDFQRLPADFETLVKGKYLKAMPKPPPGKRFALDRNRMQVVVMD